MSQTDYHDQERMALYHFAFMEMKQTNGTEEINQKRAFIVPPGESKFLWILTLVLALAGILLRLERALLNRSFRGDEAAMASAIQTHSLIELVTKPLGATVTAPFSFLVVEKLVTGLFGFQDLMYRLLPLLAGCLSVILMFFLARELVGNFGAAFAVGAFSLNWMLSFYSSDLKQYSTDVAMALLIYFLAARYFKNSLTRNILWLAGVGLAGIFFSHPTIFLLSAIGPVLVYQTWSSKQELRKIFLMGCLWIGVFLALYFLSYRVVGQYSYNVDYWYHLGALMPVPPWKDPAWFVQRLNAFFNVDLNLTAPTYIDAVLYLFGIACFFLKKKWQWAIILPGSILFTFFASGIANYPFKDRLILFLAPGTLLVIGAGIEGLVFILKSSSLLSYGFRGLLAVYLLLGPVISTYNYIQQPRAFPLKEDIRPVLSYVEKHKQPGDQFVVYDQAAVTYYYYSPFYGLNNSPTIILGDYRKKPLKYQQVIDALPKNQRIWFIFSNVLYTLNNESDRTYMFDYLGRLGGHIIDQVGGSDTFSSGYLVIIK
jgi:hypothetical protein